mgnify:CR=1 FL=1
MIPGDKSISQRALIISLASIGKTIIEDILDSEDVYHTLKAIKLLGAKVKKSESSLPILGSVFIIICTSFFFEIIKLNLPETYSIQLHF